MLSWDWGLCSKSGQVLKNRPICEGTIWQEKLYHYTAINSVFVTARGNA